MTSSNLCHALDQVLGRPWIQFLKFLPFGHEEDELAGPNSVDMWDVLFLEVHDVLFLEVPLD